MTVHRIVLGIDFSEPSLAAARWAAHHLAPRAELTLVHVIPWRHGAGVMGSGDFALTDAAVEGVRTATMHGLRGLANSLGAVRCTTTVRVGQPAEQLARVAGEEEAELIVIGRTGQGVRGAKRLGTTADRLTRVAHHPVLLPAGPLDAPPRRVLAPFDESAVGADVLRWASRVAAQCGASLTALHVVHDPIRAYLTATAAAVPDARCDVGDEERLRHEAHDWLWTRLREADIDPARTTCAVAIGDPKHEVLVAAECFESDLVVIGRHGADGSERSGIGGVARAVLRPTARSVLVVPDAGGTRTPRELDRHRGLSLVRPHRERRRAVAEVGPTDGPPAA